MSTNTITPINADNAVKVIRYAERTAKVWLAYVTDNSVTLDTVAAHATALAALAYPKDETVQTVNVDGCKTRTRYGHAVNTAKIGMKRHLAVDEDSTEAGTVNLLTADGVKALSGQDETAIVKAILAELAARQK